MKLYFFSDSELIKTNCRDDCYLLVHFKKPVKSHAQIFLQQHDCKEPKDSQESYLPKRMKSVLLSLKCRKFILIQDLKSLRQVQLNGHKHLDVTAKKADLF